jgi:cation transport protein ChaC
MDREAERADTFCATSEARRILSELPADGRLWIFAFGSILWKRRFAVSEERPAAVEGWQRKFCLGPDTRYRGNPEAPGIMLSLDIGGHCSGKVLEMAAEGREAALITLLENEPPLPTVWLDAKTPEGPVRAIAFVIERDFRGYLGDLREDVVADRLASAVGMWGSMAAYLMNTVRHLEEMGIEDSYLSRMERLVAERLAARSG